MWITYRPAADAPVGLLNLDLVSFVRLAPYGDRARVVARADLSAPVVLFDGAADDAAAYLDRLADLVRAGAAVSLPRDNPPPAPPAPAWQDHFDGGHLADMPDGRILVATPTDGTWWRWAVSTPDGVYLTSGRAPTLDISKRRAYDAWLTLPTPPDDDDRCTTCGQVGLDLTGNDAYCDAITTAHGDLVLMKDDTAGGALQCLPCNEKRLSQ